MKLLISTFVPLLFIGFAGGAYGQPDFEETKRAAEQGYARAQYNLGQMYRKGDGVPENDAEAVKWYLLAAGQGYARAQSNLGVMYRRGDGVPQNDLRAYVWLSMAAAKGNENAKGNRDIAAGRLTPEQLTRGQELATKCFESEYQDCEGERQYEIKQAHLTGEKPNVPLEADEWPASGYTMIRFIVGMIVLAAIPI
jgi:TPR repeat protein